jgi:pilus assembly protein FimV
LLSETSLAQQRADEAVLLAEQERQQLQRQMEELQARIDNVQQQVEQKDVQLDQMVASLQAQAQAQAQARAQARAQISETPAAADVAPLVVAPAEPQAVASPAAMQGSSAEQNFWPWLVSVAVGGVMLGWFAAVFLARRRERDDQPGGEIDFKTWLAEHQAKAALEPKQVKPVVVRAKPVAEPTAPVPDSARQIASMNLDDFAPDSSWDVLSPFENKVVRKRAANQDLGQFSSDLFKMPEVFDLGDLSSQVGGGETGSKENLDRLNQALAFIQQGQIESACIILNNILDEGDDQQRQEAREILSRIA